MTVEFSNQYNLKITSVIVILILFCLNFFSALLSNDVLVAIQTLKENNCSAMWLQKET